MDLPAATFTSELTFSEDQTKATILREVDFGLQKIEIGLPAVVTCDLRLNTPRFANVKSILKAKKKRVDTVDLASLGIDTTPRITIEKVESPEERPGGVLVADVDELIEKLKNESKVI